jgi:alanine-synthesizing transaminase
VIINPNNPTGAVYPPEVLIDMLDVCRRHGLAVMSDEIYDQILYDGTSHMSTAALAPDLVCLTLNGLSKAYLLAGYRSGWLVVSGPRVDARQIVLGLDTLAGMRLGANVPGQHAVAAALRTSDTTSGLVLPRGRLREQRDAAWSALTQVPGLTCVKPCGGFYAFPRIDPAVCRFEDDEQFVLDLLIKEKILVTHGRAFNWPRADHFRIVTLPPPEILGDAVTRIGAFLADYRQDRVGGAGAVTVGDHRGPVPRQVA